MKWVLRIVSAMVVLVAVAFVLVWAALAVPYFSEVRRSIVADVLTDQVGEPVQVDGDVNVVLGLKTQINAAEVTLPGEGLEDVVLAELAKLSFDIHVPALLSGLIELDNLVVNGLKVNLITTGAGQQSWSDPPRTRQSDAAERESAQDSPSGDKRADGEGEAAGSGSSNLLAFLRTRTVSIADVGLLLRNEITGFVFDFLLESFAFVQEDGGDTLAVTSNGSVNGQAFTLVGRYPTGQPFTTTADFSSINMTFNGTPEENGFSGQFDLIIEEIGDLLDVARLERVLEGNGGLSARIVSEDDILSVVDIDTRVALADGEQVTINGDIADLTNLNGFALDVNARFHPEGDPPPPASGLEDLALMGFSTEIISIDDKLELDDLLVTTNAFDQGLDQLGPISIDRIRRTPDDGLAIEGIDIQAGPLEDPYITAEGTIGDILEFEDVSVSGDANLPASLVLKSLGEDAAEAFGRVEATFAVDDAEGHLSLTDLEARSVDSSVWSLDAHASTGEVTTLDGLVVDLALDVADGASFFSALKREPVDTGPLSVSTKIRGENRKIAGELALGAGGSEITATLEIASGIRRRVDAALFSPTLAIADLRNAIAGVSELGKIGDGPAASPEAEPSAAASDAQTGAPTDALPLVVEGKGPGFAELQRIVLEKAHPNRPPLQRLVLSGEDLESENFSAFWKAPEDPNRPELQPLVLDRSSELSDPVAFLKATDIYASIDFERISGLQGVTQMSSEFVSEGGKATLGPLQFNYGPGFFSFGAEMDLVNTPDRIAVAGATDGWDLAAIMEELDVSLDANGPLSARFNLAGRTSSVEGFINSMSGSATLNMGQGRIATSLLELAGLGIFPWLFSQELARGHTDIVCVRAPIRISGSQVTFDRVVAETRSVQLVARGSVDWKRDAITLRAEPRPVGRPLARSAWPFDVTGRLSAPKFKLDIGGSRSRRADGADEMPTDRRPCEPDIYQLQ